MSIGICKLCLKRKDLQKSHLIPAAMYKYIRDPLTENPNPVVVGRKVTAPSSRQVSDYLLCKECEGLFNENGEREVLKWVWNGKNFPLKDRLAVASQHYRFNDFLAFSGTRNRRVMFIHAKAKGSRLSASALQDVCGQATKNLNFLSPYNQAKPSNLKKWNGKCGVDPIIETGE